MRPIVQLYMYTLIFLIITTSNATHDDRQNQNDIKHIQHITGLVITRAIPFAIPQPYQVTVEQEVPYPVKVPVGIPVDRPYEVHIPKPYTVPVLRPVPYPVHRLVPYPVPIPLKQHEEQTTPSPSIQDYHHRPFEIPNHLEYDLTASLTKQVPVRVSQPATPSPVTPHPQVQQPTTPEPTPNPYNFIETMRLPLKPAGQMTAVSYQAHRPYAGFNLGSHQFADHPQYPPYETVQQQQPQQQQQLQQQQQQQQHHHPQQQHQQQQQTIVIRRPLGFHPDPSMIGAYQHQPNPELEHLHGADPNDLSDEQNHDLLANFAEGALFNLNNRLRRHGSSKEVATKKSSTMPSSTTTTTTSKPPKKT